MIAPASRLFYLNEALRRMGRTAGVLGFVEWFAGVVADAPGRVDLPAGRVAAGTCTGGLVNLARLVSVTHIF